MSRSLMSYLRSDAPSLQFISQQQQAADELPVENGGDLASMPLLAYRAPQRSAHNALPLSTRTKLALEFQVHGTLHSRLSEIHIAGMAPTFSCYPDYRLTHSARLWSNRLWDEPFQSSIDGHVA